MTVELRVEVVPPWPFRLGGGSADGLMRRRGASLQRLLHLGGERVHVGVVQPAPDRVLFAARAATEEAAADGIARMRFATGVDDDLRPFHDRFRSDPVIGRAVRANPRLRVRRRPLPWEALLAAVTEQLIEFERAVAIQRRLIAVLGYRCPETGLRDGPPPAAVAALAPARLASFDLAPKRAIALRRVAAEVAAGRADLEAAMGAPASSGLAEAAARRLLAITDIGPWTVEILALHGHGRHDVVPAGDLGLRQDRRAADDRAPEGARRGRRGARVLRALRRLEGPRGGVPALRLGVRPRGPQPFRPDTPGSSPSPGRNSLVSARAATGGRLSSPLSCIQRP